MPVASDRRLRAAALGIALGVLAVAPAAASASMRRVAPGGATSGSCAAAKPCDLAYALRSATQGDSVIIAAGRYAIPDIQISASGLIVRGAAGSRPVISGRLLFSGSTGTIVSHLAISGTRGTYPALGYALGSVRGRVVFQDVVVHMTGAGGVGAFVNDGGVLRDSLIRCSGARCDAVDTFHGTAEVRNVTAIAEGANSAAVAAGGGPYSATSLVRNTIARGAGADLRAVAGMRRTSDGTIVVQSSCFRPGKAAALPGLGAAYVKDLGSNIFRAPIFANAAAGDYHQASRSPTIDAGVRSRDNGRRDFDGEARRQGTAPDIGADEFPGSD